MSFVKGVDSQPHPTYTKDINQVQMTITFTAEENRAAKITVFEQGIDRNNFDDRELPTDIHLVEYEIDGTLYVDSVRAYKTVDIFDFYYDRVTAKGGTVISITNGFGRVKPKLYTGKGPAQG